MTTKKATPLCARTVSGAKPAAKVASLLAIATQPKQASVVFGRPHDLEQDLKEMDGFGFVSVVAGADHVSMSAPAVGQVCMCKSSEEMFLEGGKKSIF